MEYIKAIYCDIQYQLIHNNNKYQIIKISKSMNENKGNIDIILIGKDMSDKNIINTFYFTSSDYIQIINPFKTN